MPAGCDFVCETDGCEVKGCRITINNIWPIAPIDNVIKSKNVQDNEDFKKALEQRKANGEEFACIQFPNHDNIKACGAKIEQWCPKCKIIVCQNVAFEEVKTDNFEEAFANIVDEEKIVARCCDCDSELLTFNDMIENGLSCPYCENELTQYRWCS